MVLTFRLAGIQCAVNYLLRHSAAVIFNNDFNKIRSNGAEGYSYIGILCKSVGKTVKDAVFNQGLQYKLQNSLISDPFFDYIIQREGSESLGQDKAVVLQIIYIIQN